MATAASSAANLRASVHVSVVEFIANQDAINDAGGRDDDCNCSNVIVWSSLGGPTAQAS